MFYYKLDGVATLATAKAFVDAFGGGDVEAGRILIVKRATGFIA